MLQSSSESSQHAHSHPYIIGPFHFSHKPGKHLRRTLKHLYRNFKPTMESLRMENGRLEELMPREAIERTQKIYIDRLIQFHVSNNKLNNTSFLLKCHFDNLQVLNLGRNKLASLEDIGKHLHFPQLEELLLCNNQLVRLRGIRKVDLPMLSKLTIQLNYLSQIEQLYQAHFMALTHLEICRTVLMHTPTTSPTSVPYSSSTVPNQKPSPSVLICQVLDQNLTQQDHCLRDDPLNAKFPYLANLQL